ncbi:gap junction alpha-9 protein [Tiliqua scincoides]|uniref:gap junction alpha-9 protein n=1 Tax=Tiliqua scincoides TaxID=71010 RepID=UPI0034634EFF
MGDWNFLGGILEEVHIHSTMIGKIWLTILFIFRMLVLGVAAEDVWNDEQSEFICNTDQPGCRNVCYDHAFPISLIRYWVLQVIFVSSPSLVYMGHALYRLRTLEKERQKKKAQVRVELEVAGFEMMEDRRRLERELRHLEHKKLNKAPLQGSLLCTYVIHIFTRSALEIGFMIGQYLLYGFQLDPLYKCQRDPCPNVVDCFVSRPTEKTVFIVFMQLIATVSLCLNVLEIAHLGFKKIRKGVCGPDANEEECDDTCCVNKSKMTSVIVHPCIGVSAMPQKTLPTAPSGYNLLMENQLCLVHNSHSENSNNYSCYEEQEEVPVAGVTGSYPLNTSSNNSEGLNKALETKISVPQSQGEKKKEPRRSEAFVDGTSNVAWPRWAERPSELSALSPERNSLPVNCAQRPQGAGDSCSTGAESGGGSVVDSPPTRSHPGQQSPLGRSKPRALFKTEHKRLSSWPDVPDSAEEKSPESKHSSRRRRQSRKDEEGSPLLTLSPLRQVSMASNASGSSGGNSTRRAPTDLQI